MRTYKSDVLWPAPPGRGLPGDEVEAWIKGHDPIRIRITWELIDGKHEPVDIRLARPSGAPIKASEIHAIPFGTVFGLATAYWDHAIRLWPEERQREFMDQWNDGGVRRGRPRTYGPEHWLRVAEVYTEAKANGETLRRAIRAEFDCSEATARNWITNIRRMGLIK